MPRKGPTEEERAEFRKNMNDMMTARLNMLGALAPKYAEVLGTFRAALEKSGFSSDESIQIILKVAEQGRRPMFMGGFGGPWRKR